jgi:ATP-dependent RNA helicase RhlE
VRTKVRAERVAAALLRANIPSLTMHGDKDQRDRLSVMQQFREGKVKVLIATDVSARGIDIPDVDLVINYDLPTESENYVHRVGRTGRGTKNGQAITFCSPEEKPVLDEIEAFLTKKIRILDIAKEDYTQTKSFYNDAPDRMKSLMEEIEEAEKWERKANRKKK